MQVLNIIRRSALKRPELSVLFFTPCHATPYYTHIHAPVRMRFLDCSPPGWAPAAAQLNSAQLASLNLPVACPTTEQPVSQRQCFEHHPEAYLGGLLTLNADHAPTTLVGYGSMMDRLAPILHSHQYKRSQSWINCVAQTDPDTECRLELWERVA